jgi:uncharacterized FlaG/YvyC family protein
MSEESGSISSIGALSSLNNYAPAQDNTAAPQSLAAQPAAVASVSSQASRPSAQDVQTAVAQINAHLASVDRVLSLKVDPGSGYTVAQISNSVTGEVLQQMPTADHIQLERMLARWSHGGNILMDVEA